MAGPGGRYPQNDNGQGGKDTLTELFCFVMGMIAGVGLMCMIAFLLAYAVVKDDDNT